MSKDYGGYFYKKNGVTIFVPTTKKEEADEISKKVYDSIEASSNGKLSTKARKTAKELFARFPFLKLDKEVYGKYCHIFFSTSSKEELGSPLVTKEIDNYIVTAINFGDTEYYFIDIFDIGLNTFRDIIYKEFER